MSVCAELTKLQRKEIFDTNLDPDPEWLSICHTSSNALALKLLSCSL